MLQWTVPLVLLFAAALAVAFVWRRRGRTEPFVADRGANTPHEALTWPSVERLLGASFEANGYAVEFAEPEGPHGGVDLVLTKGREKTLVQCQQWRARTVGVASVREFYSALESLGATRGIVVTGGEFTTDARDFAHGRKLELLNGRALGALLRAVRT
jgi:restriction system protein